MCCCRIQSLHSSVFRVHHADTRSDRAETHRRAPVSLCFRLLSKHRVYSTTVSPSSSSHTTFLSTNHVEHFYITHTHTLNGIYSTGVNLTQAHTHTHFSAGVERHRVDCECFKHKFGSCVNCCLEGMQKEGGRWREEDGGRRVN